MKRPGRPWAPARGTDRETNELVAMVRGWLDGAGISVPQLHRRLTAEHFTGGLVPELRKLRDQLSGPGLTWDLVEAIADVCLPDEAKAAQCRGEARRLWDAARSAPTPLLPRDAVPARDLVAVQQRTIAALEELSRVRQAYETSERARTQALQMAMLLFGMLGQAQERVAELTRRLDALAATVPQPAELATTRNQLGRAQGQEADLRGQLERAEAERDRAQRLADHAARRIQELEAQLRAGRGAPTQPSGTLALPDVADGSGDEALDEVDQVLEKAREVLDRQHEAVQSAADDLGWQGAATAPDDGAPRVIRDGRVGAGLSRTTPNNSLTAETTSETVKFLGSATRRISRGIDLDEIVLGLCRATVPTFSDAILVYLRDPLPVGNERPIRPFVLRLRRTDRRRAAEGKTGSVGTDLLPYVEQQADEFVPLIEQCEVRSGGALSEVLRGVRPVFGDSAAARAALPDLLGVGPAVRNGHHVILAPLRGRRRVIGAAVFLRRPDRPAFEPNDLLVAAQLATHTALGIDKAVLYGREVYVADELQRTMLPDSLPQPTGVKLASRYLPAAETARVGGDWYDAIPLPGSRVALVVGDVMGHSMASAAIMGQLRTTAQTLAGLDLPPQEVLHRLDEQAQRLGTDRMATCMYAVYDPVSHRITIANAGHPPPVLLHLGGRAEVLRVPPGAPIGVGGVDFEAVELDAPAGATLLLYTDGLVESRLRDVWTGIEQLRKVLQVLGRLCGPDQAPPLEALCDTVLDELLGAGDRDDDVALLGAHFEA